MHGLNTHPPLIKMKLFNYETDYVTTKPNNDR